MKNIDSIRASDVEKLTNRQVEVERLLHKDRNTLDIHGKQIYLLEQRVGILDEHREGHALTINMIKSDQYHATEFTKSIANSLDKLTAKFETGIKDIVAEIASLKQSRGSAETIIHLLKPIIYMAIGGGSALLVNLITK